MSCMTKIRPWKLSLINGKAVTPTRSKMFPAAVVSDGNRDRRHRHHPEPDYCPSPAGRGPLAYLVETLQRVQSHPAKRVEALISVRAEIAVRRKSVAFRCRARNHQDRAAIRCVATGRVTLWLTPLPFPGVVPTSDAW